MSGGRFNYDQYKIGYIAEAIESEIEKSGRPKTKQELKDEFWYGDEQELNHYKYPDDVTDKFKEAVILLKKAEIYAHRIDWLLSGDDSEELFLKRLEEDLKNKITS